jgi:energy-coupling factor transport system permease protein
VTLRPAPAVLVAAAVAAAALLTDRIWAAGALVALLLAAVRRAPRSRRRPYLVGSLGSALGVFLVWPLLGTDGYHVLWSGPTIPVLGVVDVTSEEVRLAALYALRFAAVSLAFAAYALLVDHDRLLGRVSIGRRSALTAVLATRLVPTLERDAAGLVEAVRGRGVAVEGVRARARVLSPLVAGSLERGLNLAEAMEARGFGRPGRTRAPAPRWTVLDAAALAAAAALVAACALWL